VSALFFTQEVPMKTHHVTSNAAKTPRPTKRPARPGTHPTPRPTGVAPDTSAREQMIREAAYFYFEARGQGEGNDLEDWLRAEADIERQLGGHPDDATEH
jgi:hypothetical protein